MTRHPAYVVGGQHPADRVMDALARGRGDLDLAGEARPSDRQVAAVLRALADFTLNRHMLGEAVRSLGSQRRDAADGWDQAVGLGRLFHGMADELTLRDVR